METDAQQASLVQHRPPDMKKWCNDMLKGHPGVHATTWEQSSNSLALQFKGAMDTMSQSLRIKEEAYATMFQCKEKALREFKGNIKKIKDIEEQVASQTKSDDKVKKLKQISLSCERN